MSRPDADQEKFLKFVFRDFDPNIEVPVLGYQNGRGGVYPLRHPTEYAITHYSIGLQTPTDDGPWRDGGQSSRKANFTGGVVLVLDDVREKVEPPDFEPSFIVETKPGSEQWGYALAEPLRDVPQFDGLIQGAIKAGLSDPGMSNVVRWARPPGSKPPGKAHRARLVSLRARVYTPMDLIDGLGLKYAMGGLKLQEPVDIGEQIADPVLDWLNANGLCYGESGQGWYGTECPRGCEHSNGDTKAYYRPRHELTGGVFHCFHGHNKKKPNTDEFFAWVAQQGGPSERDLWAKEFAELRQLFGWGK